MGEKQPQYAEVEADVSPLDVLAEILQNEGIAHYISHGMKEKLTSEYEQSTELKEHERNAFENLSSATKTLANPSSTETETSEILTRANAGRFWSKFGSIAGMFMVHHIATSLGESAMQEGIAGGPIRFLEQYRDVQVLNTELPRLPEELDRLLGAREDVRE